MLIFSLWLKKIRKYDTIGLKKGVILLSNKKLFNKIAAVMLLPCIFLAASCTPIDEHGEPADTTPEQITTPKETATTTAPKTETETTTEEPVVQPAEKLTVSLVCAGDNLIHSPIYNQASARAGGDGYDFSFVYEKIEKYIQPADLAILNQETVVTDAYPPSNYPLFCSPEALGDYMVEEVGFDVISMANNHVLDMGESGMVSSLEYWDSKHPDIVRYGAYLSEEDMNDIRVKEVNGVTFAFLGYMEHTNGLTNPENLGTRLVYLSELDTVEQQIKLASKLADVVIVSPHFGVEVSNIVTDQQRELAKKFVDWGADIVIGTQPHTVQECEWIEREDGTSGFVFYCLGNFVSAMNNYLAMVGGIGEIGIELDPVTREVTLTEPKLIPIITHYDAGYRNVTIYPYAEYDAGLAAAHGCGLSIGMIESVLGNVQEEFLSIE